MQEVDFVQAISNTRGKPDRMAVIFNPDFGGNKAMGSRRVNFRLDQMYSMSLE